MFRYANVHKFHVNQKNVFLFLSYLLQNAISYPFAQPFHSLRKLAYIPVIFFRFKILRIWNNAGGIAGAFQPVFRNTPLPFGNICTFWRKDSSVSYILLNFAPYKWLMDMMQSMLFRKYVAGIFLMLSSCVAGLAQAQAPVSGKDSLNVYLMTCDPGTEIYAQYGHTAIRVRNERSGEDLCFNYGTFSFRTPHFLYRFIKGETDYELGIVPYSYFKEEYEERGSAVHHQLLNLTAEEKLKLWNSLMENYLPENRVYRYNFFYDNCTTRARDRIEEAVNGKIVYPVWKNDKTYRDIVHEFNHGYPWARFGADLCLGAEADKPISERQQMFAPFYLMKAFAGAQVVDAAGRHRPLVNETVEVPAYKTLTAEEKKEFPLSPMACALILLGVTLVVSWREYATRKIYWGFDALLFGAQGLAGCVLTFLFFFSTHPTVGSNWLILIFNPIPLLYLPLEIYSTLHRRNDYYHWYNLTILTLFILFSWVIPQQFNLVVLPLAVVLVCPSVVHLLIRRKQAQNERK